MKRLSALLTAATFFFIASFAPLLAAHHLAHHDGCPFMFNPEVHCVMSPIEHLKTIQKHFAATTSELLFLLTIYLPTLFFLYRINLASRLPLSLLRRSAQHSSLYQLLFSDGILHSKAP
jgi:hypothetical protein